jgi:hypothetical protein
MANKTAVALSIYLSRASDELGDRGSFSVEIKSDVGTQAKHEPEDLF